MGLDSVELIMAFEETFSLRIPDAEAAKLETPGLMYEYVLHALRARGEHPDEEALWQKIKALIVDQTGVRPDEVTKTAHFVRDLRID